MGHGRTSIRHRRRVHVTLGTTPVFTNDVGPGGFAVELMRTLPPGTAVQGTIRVGDLEVGYAGVIAWAKAGAPHMALRGKMGVRFTRLPADVAQLLSANAHGAVER
jgi:hypothetical protein